ncbi:MAG: glycosyl hydrolase [Deltaproteobacteria bacterium]|nr:glycosyl hydrolase [Deltaproteobacteria bacterium]
MHPRALVIAMAAVSLALAGIASAAGFKDVLDTPALPSPLAEKSLLNAVAVGGKRVVCVGRRGIVVYSDDEGKSWRQASVPVSSDLTAVCFVSAKKGWAVGHDGVVLRTEDGGATWAKQMDGRDVARIMGTFYAQKGSKPVAGVDATALKGMIDRIVAEGPDKPFLEVWFENETTGFIVGAFNLIFRTSDGGKSWEPWYDRTENPTFLHLYAIRPIGGELFIAGEQGLVLKLDGKTGTFRSMKVPYNGSFFGIAGTGKAVVVFGLRGNVYRSTDRGKSWKKVEAGVSGVLTGGAVTPEGRLVLVGQAGDVIASSDEGASFQPAGTQLTFPVTGVAALGRGKVALAGFVGTRVLELK